MQIKLVVVVTKWWVVGRPHNFNKGFYSVIKHSMAIQLPRSL